MQWQALFTFKSWSHRDMLLELHREQSLCFIRVSGARCAVLSCTTRCVFLGIFGLWQWVLVLSRTSGPHSPNWHQRTSGEKGWLWCAFVSPKSWPQSYYLVRFRKTVWFGYKYVHLVILVAKIRTLFQLHSACAIHLWLPPCVGFLAFYTT